MAPDGVDRISRCGAGLETGGHQIGEPRRAAATSRRCLCAAVRAAWRLRTRSSNIGATATMTGPRPSQRVATNTTTTANTPMAASPDADATPDPDASPDPDATPDPDASPDPQCPERGAGCGQPAQARPRDLRSVAGRKHRDAEQRGGGGRCSVHISAACRVMRAVHSNPATSRSSPGTRTISAIDGCRSSVTGRLRARPPSPGRGRAAPPAGPRLPEGRPVGL